MAFEKELLLFPIFKALFLLLTTIFLHKLDLEHKLAHYGCTKSLDFLSTKNSQLKDLNLY